MAANQAVVGQVVQPVVVGQPLGGGPMYVQDPNHQMDQQSVGIGWVFYGIGWVVCCCCGPCGPIFWCIVAVMHYSKPKELRDRNPQEKVVAKVSLATACCCTVVTIIVVTAYLSLIAYGAASTACTSACADYRQGAVEGQVCFETATKDCYPPGVRGMCDFGSELCISIEHCDMTCATFDSGLSSGDVVCYHSFDQDCRQTGFADQCEDGGRRCIAK
mmetsp:Transcript_31321/g.79218  ORF Transcript_31321/g.79218 Transcript_31321/m.79218 type:complete len:217 (-) Transcript_31321:97-747(-)